VRTTSAAADARGRLTAGRLTLALAVTVGAAAVELVGSWHGASLFLVADGIHLVAHVAIFAVLFAARGWSGARREDAAAVAVVVLVLVIALGITAVSGRALVADRPHPDPATMLLSLVGLAANVTAAAVLAAPARRWLSFRAALTHELSDASLTIAGLLGAAAIAMFGWRWVDPVLSLAVGVWLTAWSAGLLVRRARGGRDAWPAPPVA
jgi:cobalt-zinc-cadmium efflux system protein